MKKSALATLMATPKNINVTCPLITPTLGDNLVTNPSFEEGNPPTGFSAYNTPTTFEQSSLDAVTGTYSARVVASASGKGFYVNKTVVAGEFYKLSGYQKIIGGAGRIYANSVHWLPGFSVSGGSTYSKVSGICRALGTAGIIYAATLETQDSEFLCDDYSIQLITWSSSITNLGDIKRKNGSYLCSPTVLDDTLCGIIIEYLDNDNFILAYVNRVDNKAYLDKKVAGTWTNVINGAITYGDEKVLRVVVSGTDHSLFYDAVQVGTTQTIDNSGMGTSVYGWNTADGNSVGRVRTIYNTSLDIDTELYTFTDDTLSDYVVNIGIESALALDGNQLDLWYHKNDDLYYGYTTDPDLQTWTLTGEIDLSGYYYPNITKHPTNGNYYLLTSGSQDGRAGLYMFSSSDKRTWTIMNSGDPVLATSVTESDWNYLLINGYILFIEGQDTFYIFANNNTATAVCSSTLTELSFTNLTPIMPTGGEARFFTPSVYYLPTEDVLIAFGCDYNSDSSQRVIVYYNLSLDNIFDTDKWFKTKFVFEHSGTEVHTSDPIIVELSDYFNQKTLLSYNYDQYENNVEGIQPNSLRQAFCDLTLSQIFYELVRKMYP